MLVPVIRASRLGGILFLFLLLLAPRFFLLLFVALGLVFLILLGGLVDIPQANHALFAAARERFAIWAESQREHTARVGHQRLHPSSGLRVPELDAAIVPGRRE